MARSHRVQRWAGPWRLDRATQTWTREFTIFGHAAWLNIYLPRGT
jgi:hypothetical protein